MDRFLNFGLLGVPVSLAIRYFWASFHGLDVADFRTFEEWEYCLYGASLLLVLVWIWNVAIRHRCGACRSANVQFLGEREVDRFVGTKKVPEKLNNGKSTTRTVSTTFVKLKRDYCCGDCPNSWSTGPYKRELD